MQDNILIYSFNKFSIYCGGHIALYRLASILDSAGLNVRMSSCIPNPLFNKFYNNDFPVKKATVIYPEIIAGNPLRGYEVVRWILADVGKQSKNNVNTWDKNDLVYFFNTYPDLQDKDFYKQLMTLYINPIYMNLGRPRSGTCYTMRKKDYFQPSNGLTIPVNEDWFEIKGAVDYLSIFNNYKFFVSYDPMTFMSFIAALCGCISIVNPCEGMNKQRWLERLALWPYLNRRNLNNISGIAYGLDDVQYAIETLPLLREQMIEFCDECKLTVQSFANDIRDFRNQLNTVGRVFKDNV